ncbi:MAG: cytochrome c peroxidase [Candidatus Thioglobus sp.]|uniref:cytochrome-c peroxidase n=1 Tax=Candidatus Thioglobus sp. TaxID=2026721 RepID=UPI00260362CB|nr:cytochrome c peroxidase [Candidatus Thioglobus sp.]MDC9726770.1 cytochrome c peroxidase [Candidatus Thioglobus sp.]
MKLLALLLPFLLLSACSDSTQDIKVQKTVLGQSLFFDTILSKNNTQSCAQCHNPAHGFIDDRDNGVAGMASLGDDGKSIGDRNAPTAAYAMLSPEFHFDKKSKEWIGGQFYDGREADLAGQAGGPPTNPVEMGMPSKQALVDRFKNHPAYSQQFKDIFGDDIFNNADKAYGAMAQSIAEFEKTETFAPFDSKYDRYLKGEYELTDLEDLGRSLFFSNNNTNCSTCHQLKSRDDAMGETFTNYEYHNIGVPTNIALRQANGVDVATIDHGFLSNPQINSNEHDGKIKVPTLRNIAVTGPYMHNGVFAKLSTVVEFYDKYINKERVNNPETNQPWADAEVPNTVNNDELKKGKKLSDRKVQALVVFLNTLTDKRYEHLISKDN